VQSSKKTLTEIFSRQGMTLVEALMTVLIAAVILAATSMVLIAGSASWQVNSTKVELQQGLRRAMEWMAQDLRAAGNSVSSITNVPADGTWYNTINFKTATGVSSAGAIVWSTDTIQYVLGGTGNSELRRNIINSGGSTVSYRRTARNMTALRIRRQGASADLVEVSLSCSKRATSGQQVTMSTSFTVHLRN
jgi:Tfp pilus assembly protein PilW